MGETGRYDTHLTVDQALEIKPVYVEDCDVEGGYSHQGINQKDDEYKVKKK